MSRSDDLEQLIGRQRRRHLQRYSTDAHKQHDREQLGRYNAGGGGIWNSGSLAAVNTTVAYNHCSSSEKGGGVFDSDGATAILDNTIVAVNTGYHGLLDDIDGSPGSVSGNITWSGSTIPAAWRAAPKATCASEPRIPVWVCWHTTAGRRRRSCFCPAARPSTRGAMPLAVDPATSQALTYDRAVLAFLESANGVVDVGAYGRHRP